VEIVRPPPKSAKLANIVIQGHVQHQGQDAVIYAFVSTGYYHIVMPARKENIPHFSLSTSLLALFA